MLHPAGVKAAVAAHKPKIVFLTSPNNPDGSMLSTEDLLELLKLPVLVWGPRGLLAGSRRCCQWRRRPAVCRCWGSAEHPLPGRPLPQHTLRTPLPAPP